MSEKQCKFCDAILTEVDLNDPNAIQLDCCVLCTDLDRAVEYSGGLYVLPSSFDSINIRTFYSRMRALGKTDAKIKQMLKNIRNEIEKNERNREEADRLTHEAIEKARQDPKNKRNAEEFRKELEERKRRNEV